VDLRDPPPAAPVVMSIPVRMVPARTLDTVSHTPRTHALPSQEGPPDVAPSTHAHGQPARHEPFPMTDGGGVGSAPDQARNAGWSQAEYPTRRSGRHAAREVEHRASAEPASAVVAPGFEAAAGLAQGFDAVPDQLPAPLLTPWVGLEQSNPAAMSVLPGNRRDRGRG
jgi:hypothetical protein